jgi:hypothetical protein
MGALRGHARRGIAAKRNRSPLTRAVQGVLSFAVQGEVIIEISGRAGWLIVTRFSPKAYQEREK